MVNVRLHNMAKKWQRNFNRVFCHVRSGNIWRLFAMFAPCYCRFQPTLHPGAFCARVWFWGVTWGIRSSVTSACISVVFLEIESYLKPLSCDTKNVRSGAILRNSVFGVLSLCTRNISLYSQRILMVQHVPEGPFNSVSNDMRYSLYCATFGNHPSSA